MADQQTNTEGEGHHGSVHLGEPDSKGRRISPWAWVPSVYYAQGLQYVIVTQLFVIIFFQMGMALSELLLWIGLLQLPWTLKPLWGPLVDQYNTKRFWVVFMQLLVGSCFLGVAFILTTPSFFMGSIIILMFLAVFAATHDIAADGYYMLGLSEKQQAFHVGVRSTFFRLALIVANGLLVALAGMVQSRTGLPPVETSLQAVASVEEVSASGVISGGKGDDGQEIIISPSDITIAPDSATTFTVRLAQAPPADETRVVTLSSTGGGVASYIGLGPERHFILERKYQRLDFTKDNWETGIDVVITTDPKTPVGESLSYRAYSGNVALSWAVVVGTCAATFLIFGAWHVFILPFPFQDKAAKADNKPPFVVALSLLIATVGVPAGVIYLVWMGITKVFTISQPMILADGSSELATKAFTTTMQISAMVIPAILVYLVVKIKPIWSPFQSMFKVMSDKSGIGFFEVFGSFFRKDNMTYVLAFLLTFRLGEAQLASVKTPFLIDAAEKGGTALSLGELAFTNTVFYLLFLTIGGLLGGFLISSYGLKRVIWFMVAGMHLPNLLYIYLAAEQPGFWPINAVVAVESFGYGFGFAAYLMVMILAAQGPYKTAHYAICTGAMALGYMVPSMLAGFLQELLGYTWFFTAVMFFVIPGTMLIPLLKIDPNFGKSEE